MFSTILNTYNPKDKRSYGILRLFAEDLTEGERIQFVKSIFERGSWILPTEISKISNSIELKHISNIKFHEIFDKWVTKRIEHSSNIKEASRDPFITVELISEFRELLLSLRNLNFSSDLLIIFDVFFDNCNPSYFKKFLKNSISVVIEEYNEAELEIFFKYFSHRYIEKKSINYSNFIYIYLNQLAFSYKIHDLSSDFLKHLEILSDSINNSDLKVNYNLLISILLIDLIKNRQLDLSNSKYDVKIQDSLNSLEKGDYNNLGFYKFLKQFNYSFSKLDFSLEMDAFLKQLNETTKILKNTNEQHKKDILNHYIKLSDRLFEFFLFFLEHCSAENSKKYFIDFINLIDELRSSFSELLWFDEFLNFVLINGDIKTKITNGYEVKIEEILFNKKVAEKKLELKLSPDFIMQNSYGFLNQANMNDFIKKEEINSFYISTVNYSIFNKGKIITLVPSTKAIDKIISRFEIKALFSAVEVYLIEKAHKYLDLNSPFSKKNIALKQLVFSEFIDDFNFNFSVESFWNILKAVRPSLYDSIYVKYQNNEESFKKIINAYESNHTVSGIVNFRINGGMSVDVFGIEAFLPGSQIDIKPIKDYDIFLERVMDFKVLKIDLQTKNIVISHKALIEKENDTQKEKFISELEIGQIVEGIIKNITSYGAFVDLGFIDGLIHITDLTWSRINHPNDVVQLDQRLKVVVLDFDNDKQKIQLGLKQLDTNILKAFNELNIGDIVNCEIALITDYGVLVEINAGNEALIHISELSWLKVPVRYSDRKNFIQNLYSIGDKVDAIILKIDTEEHKISLSIKRVMKDPWTVMNIGNKVMGKVTNLSHLGAEIELLNGPLGFIDISEICYSRVPKSQLEKNIYIKRKLRLGMKIEVSIISIDKVNQKLSLSLRQLKENLWLNLIKDIKKKDIIKGKVIKIVNFGAFIKLNSGLEGLLHITNMNYSNIPERNEDRFVLIRSTLFSGQIVEVEVVQIDIRKFQISFGLKQLQQH